MVKEAVGSLGALAALRYVVAPPLVFLGRFALGVARRHSWLGWWAAGYAAASYGNGRRHRRKLRTEFAAVLADISGPDLTRLLGSLPAWVSYPEYERVSWLNGVIKQAWPFIDKAVERVLRDNLAWLLERPPVNLRLFGLRGLRLDTLTLGGLPASLGGVKAWRSEADEVVVDVELRLAGDEPNLVLSAHTLAGDVAQLRLSELQLFGVVRLRFAPLLPTFPCFGAIGISLMGPPFCDFSLKLLAGDLMATPGLDMAVGRLIRELLQLMVFPQQLLVPLFDDDALAAAGGGAGGAAALALRPRGVLLVRLLRGRGLPATDLASGSTHPFIKMRVSGQRDVAETGKRVGRTQRPEWDQLFCLAVTDVRLQTLQVDLYDSGVASAEAHVGAASLPLGELLGDGERLWAGWLPLARGPLPNPPC